MQECHLELNTANAPLQQGASVFINFTRILVTNPFHYMRRESSVKGEFDWEGGGEGPGAV